MKLDPTTVSSSDSSAFPRGCCPCVAYCDCVCEELSWRLEILLSLCSVRRAAGASLEEKIPEVIVHLLSKGCCNVV